MRRLLIALGLLVIGLAQAGPASAETYSWDAGIPKNGVQDTLYCVGSATVGDDTATLSQHFGMDMARYANPATRQAELDWRKRYGTDSSVQAVQGWYRYQRGIELPADAVNVTCTPK